MEHEKICALLEENMKSVLRFSLSHLSDVHEAEELSGDIICDVLAYAPKLRDEGAFLPFMWQIARRRYADHIRRKKRYALVELEEELPSDELPMADEVILREDLSKLRRELSLLTEQYRRATVMYYIEDKSCAEIAEEIGVSVEMAKYYLFRARKKIREGMNMERTLGEKSYAPQEFHIDFWGTCGGEDSEYRAFRERKLGGNILLTAYYTPVTLAELSMELGVAVPYLEDECRLLKNRQYLTERGGRYQTNIPIFTKECTAQIMEKMGKAAKLCARRFTEYDYGEFSRLFDRGDDNLTRWLIFTLCCHFATGDTTNDEVQRLYGPLPSDGPYSLVNGGGGRGLVFGRTEEWKNSISGVWDELYSTDGRGEIVAINFAQVRNGQHFRPWSNGIYTVDPISCTAFGGFDCLDRKIKKLLTEEGYVKDGKSNFAVFSREEYTKLSSILREQIDCITEFTKECTRITSEVCADHAPSHVRRAAGHAGAIIYSFHMIEVLADILWKTSWLGAVSDTDKPCMFEITNEV